MMYKATEKTKGVPGDCILQISSGDGVGGGVGGEECFATGNFCKADGGKCPFDDDDIIQLEFKKEK